MQTLTFFPVMNLINSYLNFYTCWAPAVPVLLYLYPTVQGSLDKQRCIVLRCSSNWYDSTSKWAADETQSGRSDDPCNARHDWRWRYDGQDRCKWQNLCYTRWEFWWVRVLKLETAVDNVSMEESSKLLALNGLVGTITGQYKQEYSWYKSRKTKTPSRRTRLVRLTAQRGQLHCRIRSQDSIPRYLREPHARPWYFQTGGQHLLHRNTALETD